ncbi:hypothetical protein AHAS_Ahas04G0186700 [Arachis hypogaea]
MDAAEPFNVPVNPEALGIPVSTIFLSSSILSFNISLTPFTLSDLLITLQHDPYKQETQCCQDLQSPLCSLSGTMKLERNHHRRNTESTLETKQKESFAGIETARTPSVCWSDTKVSNVIMLSGTRTICSNLEKSDQYMKL